MFLGLVCFKWQQLYTGVLYAEPFQSELYFNSFVNGDDISIEALYIYVCMPIFIYIFKEIQVCTDVGLVSANRPLSAVEEELLQSRWNHVC